jgi:hypothetical protein
MLSYKTVQTGISVICIAGLTTFCSLIFVGQSVENKVLLRAKKVGHQISVSFEKFDVVQALL